MLLVFAAHPNNVLKRSKILGSFSHFFQQLLVNSGQTCNPLLSVNDSLEVLLLLCMPRSSKGQEMQKRVRRRCCCLTNNILLQVLHFNFCFLTIPFLHFAQLQLDISFAGSPGMKTSIVVNVELFLPFFISRLVVKCKAHKFPRIFFSLS